MHQVLFHVPWLNFTIWSYGAMMVCAFLACQWLASRLARRHGIDPEIFVNATLVALLAGIVGSRLSHVLENWGQFTDPHKTILRNLWNMINIRSGGLTFYGGLILAAPVVLGFFIYKKVPARLAMDLSAPCIALGLAIGRIGCFLNGCCYGAQTDLPWAVRFPYYSNAYIDQAEGLVPGPRLDHPIPTDLLEGVEQGKQFPKPPDSFRNDPKLKAIAATQKSNPVHPAQLYSTFNSLIITAICLAMITLPHVPGRVFALMLLLEGPTRFLLEMLRVEPPVLGPMSLSMVIGAGLFVVGLCLWVGFGLWAPTRPATVTHFPPPVPA